MGRFLALGLIVASLITIIGVVVSAAGAPDLGVIDDWGRLDDIARRVASWEYVLVATVAVLAIVAPRQLRSDGAPGDRAPWERTALGLALLDLLVLAVAAIGGALAVLNRTTLQPDGTRPAVDYYTGDEQLGEIVVFAGLLVAVVVVGVIAMGAIAATRRKEQGNLEGGSSVVTA